MLCDSSKHITRASVAKQQPPCSSPPDQIFPRDSHPQFDSRHFTRESVSKIRDGSRADKLNATKERCRFVFGMTFWHFLAGSSRLLFAGKIFVFGFHMIYILWRVFVSPSESGWECRSAKNNLQNSKTWHKSLRTGRGTRLVGGGRGLETFTLKLRFRLLEKLL